MTNNPDRRPKSRRLALQKKYDTEISYEFAGLIQMTTWRE